MKVSGSYTFPVSQEVIWPMLLDPQILANVMPGCESLDLVADNQYEGILKIKVGPVQGKFKGNVIINDIHEPEGYSLEVDGRGTPGFVKGTGSLKLEADGEHTILHYDGDAQVGGRLASVGQRLIDSSAKAIIRQSLEGLEKQVEYRTGSNGAEASNGDTAPPPPVEAPSQTEFALGVARNMIEDMLAEEDQKELLRKAVIAGGLLLILFVLLDWFAGRIAAKTAQRLDR